MFCKNIWIGSRELVIVYRNGTHFVCDSYEDDYGEVFQGNYVACEAYCKEQEREYLESLF